MTRALLRTAFLGAAAVVAATGAGTSRADGLPVVGVDAGPEGVATESGGMRYVALPARGGTVVAQVERRDGRVVRSTFLPGTFVVPVVAYDGSAGGLSADGRTLVLLRPRVRFPSVRTTLAVLDARHLRVRSVVTLRGDFSFDAWSPRGRSLYLIQYTSPTDPTRYAVRAYDLRARRLLARPIVDPRERGEAMHGSPITRETSADGRWAYTLYDGAGMEPFVHALDTRQRRAVCVDLPMLAGRRDLFALKLARSSDGGSLTVVSGHRPVALVDTRSFRVSEPSEATAAAGGGRPWSALAAAAAGTVLVATAFALTVRRRRKSTFVAPERAA